MIFEIVAIIWGIVGLEIAWLLGQMLIELNKDYSKKPDELE